MPRRCSVYGCRSNYGKQTGVSTFSLPKDKLLKLLWLKNLRTDFSLLKHPIVCVQHFHKDDIIMTDTFLVKGVLKTFPRKLPKLKKGAVPCIFPKELHNLCKNQCTSYCLIDDENEGVEVAIKDSIIDAENEDVEAAMKDSIIDAENEGVEAAIEDSISTHEDIHQVKQVFCGYFASGVQQQEASLLHETILLARGNSEEILENAAINPPSNVVNSIFKTWRYYNQESTTSLFIKIQENAKHYEEKGASVFFTSEYPFAVLVVTAVMKRSQELLSAKDTVFVDTTPLDEHAGTSVTIMFTETKVGAVPIAIFMHQDVTKDSYITAFNLLKQHFSSCFGKEKAPKTFATDDNDTKKSALLEVWPSSNQILCCFYIAIAQWNYLWSSISAVQERPILMELFCNVMYANNKAEFEDSVNKLLSKEEEYPEFIQRFKALLERKYEWVLFDRSKVKNSDLSTYAEITIRILKDVVSNHGKNFTLVTLIEFCILVLDEYLVMHLSNFTCKESSSKTKLLYSPLLKKAKHELQYQCLDFIDNFLVQSEYKSSVFYLVNVTIGVCSCAIGNTGAFCKHQLVLLEEGKVKLPSPPLLTQADEYDLALLALGDKCPLSYFLSEKDKRHKNGNRINMCKVKSLYNADSSHRTSSDVQPVSTISDECIKECTNEVDRVLSLLGGKVPESSVKKLTNVLKSIQTESDAVTALQTITLSLSAKMRTKTLKAQRRYRTFHH